jgi:hypothetical protein
MTTAQVARSGPGADSDDASTTAGSDDVGAILATSAALLRETIARFESTVGRITETMVTRSVHVDRDLIVTLQDFDRLQQEFAALSDVIAHCATTAYNGAPGDKSRMWAERHGRRAIAAITVADLRDRFLRHLDGAAASGLHSPSDEIVF